MTTTALVPARNEEPRIGATVRALLAVSDIVDVVVVDDASEDDTKGVAAAAGADVLHLATRRGKGGALRAGLERVGTERVVFIDGDLGDSASLADALLAPIRTDDADLTIATPPPAGPSGFGLVERFARWGIQRACGLRVARPLSGQRAMHTELARSFPPADRFGVEAAMTIDIARAGYRILEVEAPLTHRATGRDWGGFAHRARQGVDVARVIIPRLLTPRVRP